MDAPPGQWPPDVPPATVPSTPAGFLVAALLPALDAVVRAGLATDLEVARTITQLLHRIMALHGAAIIPHLAAFIEPFLAAVPDQALATAVALLNQVLEVHGDLAIPVIARPLALLVDRAQHAFAQAAQATAHTDTLYEASQAIIAVLKLVTAVATVRAREPFATPLDPATVPEHALLPAIAEATAILLTGSSTRPQPRSPPLSSAASSTTLVRICALASAALYSPITDLTAAAFTTLAAIATASGSAPSHPILGAPPPGFAPASAQRRIKETPPTARDAAAAATRPPLLPPSVLTPFLTDHLLPHAAVTLLRGSPRLTAPHQNLPTILTRIHPGLSEPCLRRAVQLPPLDLRRARPPTDLAVAITRNLALLVRTNPDIGIPYVRLQFLPAIGTAPADIDGFVHSLVNDKPMSASEIALFFDNALANPIHTPP